MEHSKKDDIENALEVLQKIKRVDASPFVLTRITNRITTYPEPHVSKQVVWVSSFMLALFVFMNLVVIFNSFSQKETQNVNQFIESLNIFSSNALYYE